MKCVEKLKNYCVSNGIVAESKADWLQYGIERRLTTILIGCPFFILAIVLTNLNVACSFYCSFYYLRRVTNGFHAKSVHVCFVVSLLCETFFLTVFCHLLTPIGALAISIASIFILLFWAPYKDGTFPLTTTELRALKRESKIRVFTLSIIVCVLSLLEMYETAKGIITGIAMTAFLLGLAYILSGGKKQ